MIDKINMFILLIIVIAAIIIYYVVDQMKKQECYNMPINQYVEDARCEKYTWEEYMEEYYDK